MRSDREDLLVVLRCHYAKPFAQFNGLPVRLSPPNTVIRRGAGDRQARCGNSWRIPYSIPYWYARQVATEQIAVRLPEALLDELDALVASGIYESRAAAVRAGVEAITALARRQQTDRAIVAGYRRTPPTSAEHDAAIASLRDAIAEEPW